MVRLFIENQEVELDNTVKFAITSQFENLSNPTDIINDWSKTVSIPFTQKNNELFGHIYNPDKVIVDGGSIPVGIYFNPLKKLNFRLEWNNAVLITGYAKMNEIKQTAGKGTYEITLFGELGKVFQEMKKITFDESSTDTDYIIDGGKYVNETLDKSLIYKSWMSSGQEHEQLYPRELQTQGGFVNHPAYKVTDIIGFAPNNSFSEGFEYKSYQVGNNSSNEFADTLGDSFAQATGIEGSTVIPNGMLPREIGEYRSYLQLPFIYFNKLFKIFQEKAEEVTGYNFELESSWFNVGNPYWYNLVYMLKQFNPKNGNTFNNSYNVTNASTSKITYAADGNVNYSPRLYDDSWHDGGYINLSVANEMMPAMTGNTIHIPTRTTIKFMNIPVEFAFTNKRDESYGYTTNFRLNDGHYPTYEISMYDENGNYIEGSQKVFGVTYSGREVPAEQAAQFDAIVYTPATVNCAQNATYTYHLSLPYNKTFTFNMSSSYKIKIRYKWTCNTSATGGNIPIATYDSANDRWLACHFAPLVLKLSNSTTIPVEITKGLVRSDVNFILNDLWNNDFNVFNEIIKYCKMYRISISVDEFEKKVKFIPFVKYFSNYKVIDWTNKIDKSKDFIITPVTFENKYVLFNYKKYDTKLGKEYKEKYGVNYGEYRLITDYNFNTDSKDLFKDISQSMVNTDNVLSWDNLCPPAGSGRSPRIIYSFPNEIFVYNKDKDNKQIDVFGAYFFHNGLYPFNTESSLNMRDVYISDDTDFQRNNNTYFYTQNNNMMTHVYNYPRLDIVRGDNLCIFNIPKENYTYLNNYENKKSIFKNLWEDYVMERYNIQNKKITCYVTIKPYEYSQFTWNALVKVDKQLCIVNKIYDYDISNNGTTKVDLITIQDIVGYTDNVFYKTNDVLTIWSGTRYISGLSGMTAELGSFESLSEVYFSNNEKEYTTNSIKFKIEGNKVYATTLSKYVDGQDLNLNVTLHNSRSNATFTVVRYATYPYPEIKLYDSDGETERSTIYPGSRNYKLGWYGTETYGLENKPTVTIENHGTGSASINANTWTERDVMIAEGDDEWFRTEYVVDFNTNMINYSGTYIRVTITDKEGWHDTRDFPISL